MKSIKRLALLAVSVVVLFTSCSKNVDQPFDQQTDLLTNGRVSQKAALLNSYTGGFYLINEGWYGHGTGEVNFYDYATGTLGDSLFVKNNPTKNLNPATSTLQYGTIFNGKLYLVSKVGGPLVVCDENTLVESGRIAASSSNDWRAFVGVDATHGLISSQSGIYPVSLPGLTVGTKLSGASISGQVGDLTKSGNFVFALSQSAGVVVLNATTNVVVKTIPNIAVGFAKTADGAVWCAGGTSLVRIDPVTLTTTTVTLPFTANNSWGAWHPGSITASTTANEIFLANNATFAGATTIYKYVVGNSSSLSAPFITIASGKETYGSGVGYDASNNTVVVTTVEQGFTTHFSVNDLVIYNAATGSQISDLPYSGYWFPSIAVFH
ncbi:hypothetical protein A4H97_18330 [Niastella yeongjuensis]|uniref:DUF5074 domain-containing protein n=1 Tax=Niastella yeongjuensis TaxID=354355 RepID=A0A1V9DXT1_9BACT|nr:DUF5074 domain-containing protein [Niastella yeongjuensis]OQP38676.1 hypothetical protein A4H97_18330 [Niastella yeongjuensis]SEO36841.1 protein of unknown function [Niastella yeongjuensis]